MIAEVEVTALKVFLVRAVAIGGVALISALVAVVACNESLAPVVFPRWPTPTLPSIEYQEASPLPLSFVGCNPVVHVRIGAEEVPLVIDTGTTATALDRDLVESVSSSWPFIPPMRLATIPVLSVGGARYDDVRVAVFQSAVDTWPRSVKGLLGSDFLQTVAVTIDNARKRVVLRPAGAGAFEGENHRVSLSLPDDQPIRPKLDVFVDGVGGTMLFDTGNQSADAIVTPDFLRTYPQLTAGSIKATNGAPWSTRTGSIGLAGLMFDDARLHLWEDEQGPFDPNDAGNLGCGLLQRMSSLTIDYGSKAIYFRLAQ